MTDRKTDVTDAQRLEDFQRRHRQALVVVVFTDIVGSTGLKQQLGDAEAVRLIAEHHQVLREVLAEEPGAEEISTSGDSMLLALPSPSGAVRFALKAQARVRDFSRRRGRPLHDRMGIHVGEVMVEEGFSDLQGFHVDTCARVMSLAGGDQILMTRFAFDNARQALRSGDLGGLAGLRWLNHGFYTLQGVEEPVEICEVGEEGFAVLAPPPDSPKARRALPPGEEPVPGWRPAMSQLVPGTSWKLEEKLGEGGFGEVWLARHAKLNRRQVFKFCFRADRARSLKRELTLFRILQEHAGKHPHIVGVNDVYLEEPPFYLGMDYVDGADLATWCEKRGGAGAIALQTKLELVAQVADALQAAHDAGIIHRDVKPSNILVQDKPDGTPHAYLTDFGIGQLTSERAMAGVTRLGFTMTMMSAGPTGMSGTQMYMAPELVAGRPASIRSDIYSLGVIFYQLIIGDLHQPLTTDWRTRVGDPLLQEDLSRCFAGDPEERFAGAAQLAEALRAIEERRSERERLRREQAERERAAYRRGLLRATAGALAVVLIIGGLAFVARREAARAGANYRSAQKVVDDLMMLTKSMAGEQSVASESHLMPQKLADSAVQNYRDFLAQRPDDPALRLNLAKVCRSRALIYAASPVGGEEQRRVARESMEESVAILRSLMAATPENPAVREELAAALAGVALDRGNSLARDADELSRASAEALQLRRDQAAGARDSFASQSALADLLRDVSLATPAGDSGSLTSEEIEVRERLLELSPERQRPEALIALSMARERMADLSPKPDRGLHLSEAFEAVSRLQDKAQDSLPLVLRRLDLATLAAREERLAGRPSAAAGWAERIGQELARLAGTEVEAGRLAEARRSEAEGLIELAQSKQGVPTEEALGLLARAIKIEEGLGGGESTSFKPESLDEAWDAWIRLAVAAGTPERALEAARSACGYWTAAWEDPSRTAASWFRLSNLQAHLGRDDEAAESLAEARRLQAQIVRRSSEELNALVLLLAASADPRKELPGSAAAAGQAVEVLQEMKRVGVGFEEDYRREIEDAFAGQAFAGNGEVAALVSEVAGLAAPALKDSEVVDVTDAAALARELRRESFMRVKGVVASARWTGTRRTLRVRFDGVPAGGFSAQVPADLQLELEAMLGGSLEEFLPGLLVELGGHVRGYDGPPVLYVNGIEFFKVLHRAPSVPPASDLPVVPATDLTALRAALGTEVAVEGDVADVTPLRSGLATMIQLDSGGGQAVLAVVFAGQTPAIESKLGGALRDELLGRRIRIKGMLEPYGGRDPSLTGWPQVSLEDPDQIERLGDAAPVDPSDVAFFERRVGARVTVAATVGEVSRSPSGKVLNIPLREAGPGGLRAAVFPDNEGAIAAKLGGNLEAVLPRHRVRISGKVTMYEGQPQVILSNPWQIDFAP